MKHLEEITQRSRLTDVIMKEPILEIERSKDVWVVAKEDVFSSWTGRRRMNGMEHHGRVTYIDDPRKTYRGHRICGCSVCQSDVEPRHKFN